MLPSTISPMLAAKVNAPFDSEDHLFEVKWDGIRCLAFVESGRVRLQSRQLTEITHQFAELAGLGRLPAETVLDGELVVFEDAKPSLAAIRRRALLQNSSRMQHSQPNRENLFDAFDKGEAVGIRRAWRKRRNAGRGASGLPKLRHGN